MGVFVGGSRERVVADLVARLSHLQHPELVVLSAPPGSGKTRIVQEVYRALAAEQSPPGYWPLAIDDPDEAGVDPGLNRKRVSPGRVSAVAGADMPFLWWGISCEERTAGRLLDSLLGDGEVLTRHAAALYARWSRGRRLATLLREPETRARAIAIVGLVGAVAGPVGLLAGTAGRAYDLLSLVLGTKGQVDDARDLASAARDAIEEARARARASAAGATRDLAPAERPAEVDLLARSLCGAVAGTPRMPTVVVVDDAHWADPNVIRLMRRVLAHPTAPVLLVATTWPEKLGAQQAARDETGLAHVVAANRERATVVELDHLGVGALADLVREMAPRTAPDVVAALCDRAAGNPLALRLLLARKTAHRSIVDGAITLAVADVAAIRSDIHSLYQDLWDELPDAVQTTLCVAAMADEAVVVPLAVAGATALGVADAAACLAEAESPYRWVRVVRGPVLVFTEAVRREVARQHDLTGPELATAAAALIAEAGTIARADERSPVIGLVLETVLSLGRRGHHLDPEMAFGSALSLAHLAAERNDDVDELTAHLALVEWGGRLFVGDEARPQVHLLFGLAEVAARLGQHDLVVDSLEEAHRVAVDLAARHPDDVDARRDLAAALEHLGHLALDRRDLAAARTRLEEGMAISRSLVACDPQDDDAEDDRRELSVVLAQLGHLAVVEGDLGVARARYEEALALRTELMAGEADEQTYADMATLLSALGDLDVAVGDIAKGRERLEEGLFAARVLVMALPQPMQAMRMALLYLDQLSALDCAVGDLVGAREHAETALQVARGLAETRSETVEAVRDLLTALLRMADSGRVSGDLALSRDCSDEALALARELVARQPGNAIASQDLGAALSRSVTLALTVGDTAEARARIEEGMEIVTDLVERHPGSAEALNGLGAFLCCGGELEAAEGRPEAARERFEAALAVRQELVRIRPDDIGGLRVLGSCHSCLARVARDAGDRDDALVHGRRALALAVQVVTRQPTDVEARQDVVVGLDLLGELTTGAERLEHRRQGVAAAAALLDIVGPHCAAPALAADQVHDLLDALPDDADLGSEEVVVALRLAARAREHGAELSPSVARYVDRLDPPPEPPS